jgi:hypothetical protein
VLKTETKINWQSGFEEEKKKVVFGKNKFRHFFSPLSLSRNEIFTVSKNKQKNEFIFFSENIQIIFQLNLFLQPARQTLKCKS